MIIIEVKDGESIDRALRRYKRKIRDTQILKELRRRKEYTKPSVEKRNQLLKAIKRENYIRDQES
jgi:small subunit ribosomal protein S21